MKKEIKSSKWAFLLYKDSAPKDCFNKLEGLHVTIILSPWHDKDINSKTGEIKKPISMGRFTLTI